MKKTVSIRTLIIVIVISVILTMIGTFAATRVWTRIADHLSVAEPSGTAKLPSSTDSGDDSEDDDDGAPRKISLESADIDLDGIYNAMTELDGIIDKNYIYEVDSDEVKEMALYGFVAGLGDKYAGYYTAEEYSALLDDLDGDMQGIGVSVIYNADYQGIEVIDVFPDSPAMKAGMQPGDLIVYCGEDLESVASLGYEAALAKLRGSAGTTAHFVAYRGENYAEELEFDIVRDYVTEQSVNYRVYSGDDKVGIIKISSFNTATIDQFRDAVEALTSQGVKSLIFDLRNNPGGEPSTRAESRRPFTIPTPTRSTCRWQS